MIRWLLGITAIITLAAVPAMALEFNHSEHLDILEDEACSVCHVKGAKKIKPEMTPCMDCHDDDFVVDEFPGLKTHGPTWALKHSQIAKSKSLDCTNCHEPVWCLQCHRDGRSDEMANLGNNLSNVHLSDFQVTHPIAARTDPQLCTSCHTVEKFCYDCHKNFSPENLALDSHRKGWSDLKVTGSGTTHAELGGSTCVNCHPNSVLPAHEWSSRHSREARKNLVTCQTCHPQADVCMKCHSSKIGLGINPHPDNWSQIKNRIKAGSKGRTCKKCH